MATHHYRETSGLELYLGVRRHIEENASHSVHSQYDHGLDSFGVICATCQSTWMIAEDDWRVWISVIPFEHAQLIRLFLRSPALDILLDDQREYIDRLPEPPAPPEPPPVKSVYAHLLDDDELV